MARKPLRRRDVLSFERRIHVSRKMRALVLKAPAPVESNPLACEDIPVPEPGADEVLIQVLACGICRTDLHVVERELSPKLPSVITGHQVVGRIVRSGANAKKYAVGTRVGVPSLHRPDAQCEYCPPRLPN